MQSIRGEKTRWGWAHFDALPPGASFDTPRTLNCRVRTFLAAAAADPPPALPRAVELIEDWRLPLFQISFILWVKNVITISE